MKVYWLILLIHYKKLVLSFWLLSVHLTAFSSKYLLVKVCKLHVMSLRAECSAQCAFLGVRDFGLIWVHFVHVRLSCCRQTGKVNLRSLYKPMPFLPWNKECAVMTFCEYVWQVQNSRWVFDRCSPRLLQLWTVQRGWFTSWSSRSSNEAVLWVTLGWTDRQWSGTTTYFSAILVQDASIWQQLHVSCIIVVLWSWVDIKWALCGNLGAKVL